jgi:hypothetical protein
VGTAGLLASAVALVLLAAGAAQAGEPAERQDPGRPALRIVERDPLAIAGRRFEAGERVRLAVVSGGEKHVAKVRASSGGTFVVRLAGVRLDRCSGRLVVRAVGAAGSRASFTLERLHCTDASGAVD